MGLRFIRRRHDGGHRTDAHQLRFNTYFPRAFAYAYSNLGDEAASREVVGAAFSTALTGHASAEDQAFRIGLFTALRDNCRERKRKVPLDIGLAVAERDVITLTFDGGLTSAEVDAVLGTDTAALKLSSALRRMSETSSPSIIPSFYRLP